MAGGLLLVALPTLIHLISRKKARPLEFAAIAFVLQSQKKTARSMRLKELLLLAVRTLWVLLLAVGFLQPVLQEVQTQNKSNQDPKTVVLVLDRSATMKAYDNDVSRFEAAVDKARQEIRSSDPDVKWGLVLCGSPTTTEWVKPSFEKQNVLARLDEATPTNLRGSLPHCIDAAQALLGDDDSKTVQKIWVVSDMARHAFDGSVSPASGQVQIHFEKVDDENLANWFVENIKAARYRVGDKPQTQLQAGIGHVGLSNPTETTLDVSLGPDHLARQTVRFSQNKGTVVKEMTLPHQQADAKTPNAGENLPWVLRLGTDALAADNRVVLPGQTVRPLNILLVNGAAQSVPFRDEVYYLANALQQKKGKGGQLAVQVVLPESLTTSHLAEAQVVFLCNVQKLSRELAQALLQFVQTGGGLFLAMGDQIDVAWSNQALKKLLPGNLRGVKTHQLLDDQAKSMGLGLARFDARHPLFEGMVDSVEKKQIVGLTRVQTHTLMLLEPDASEERDILAHFTDDTPAMVEKQVGEGRVIFWATTLDRDWSDMAIRPGFVPLINQIVLYLTGQLANPRTWLHDAGSSHVLLPPRGVSEIRIKGPQDRLFAARQSETAWSGEGYTHQPATGQNPGSLLFDRTWELGMYEVAFRRPGGDFRVYPTEAFSVKIPAAESDLQTADPLTLETAAPLGAHFFTQVQREQQNSMWRIFFLLACLVFFIEAWILKKWFTRRR